MDPSPNRGGSLESRLAALFSKSRGSANRNSKPSSSTTSVTNSTALSMMNDTGSSIRPTTRDSDSGKEGGRDGSGSEMDGDERRGLVGKLKLPRRMKSKKQKRREREEEEVRRGRSVAERGTLENVGDNDDDADNGYRYERHLISTKLEQGDGSSMMTFESDVGALATPPPLSSHPSHIGYLTTSSPLVRVAASSSNTAPPLDGSTTRASTFPLESNAVATTEAPEVSAAYELQAPAEDNSKRTPSPVGRLAAAIIHRRSSSPHLSPERSKDSGGVPAKDKSAGGGGSRRGGVASKIGNIFPDRPLSSSAPPPERPRTAKTPTALNTDPKTPPHADKPAPVIVNTPPTPTDNSSPQFPSSTPQQKESPKNPPPIITNSNIVTSPSGNMISHRRLRSGSATLGPSKLSNITSAPLTPTPENGPISPQTGFFSNAWSAAQSAANTLTNSITNTNSTGEKARSRSGTQESKVDGDDVEVEILSEKLATPGDAVGEKELAVKTLGMGDLSLSQLGISEATSAAPTPTGSKFPESEDIRGRSGTTESLPARMAANNSMADNLENGSSANVEEHQSTPMREAANPPVAGSQTPPNGSVFEGKVGIHRSGSVRSAIGRRRKRGSSAATGHTSLGTIGAAIAAANSSLANPAAHSGSTPKLTGFAVASKKRNKDFHGLFRSVPEDDYLIEDYSCALQKEILAHGRLYVSEGHLCFSSNIFGWVNTLVMSFDEIVSVEKRNTALLFKNGLEISTLHAKHIFASFTSRDLTYDLIVGIWKLGHPSLRSSLNGVRLMETGGDKTEKDDGVMSQDASDSEDDTEDGEDVYDEDDDGMSFTQAGEGNSIAGSEVGERVVSRKASATVVDGIAADRIHAASTSADSKDYPGPFTHAPTDCTDSENHYDRMMLDEVIAAPLGKIYSLMFGPDSSAWMSRWLSVDQKCLELVMEDKKGLTDENRSRFYSYIKPLNGAIGPKQTKCLTTETLDFLDLERSVSVTMSTQTPDVPSGNVFLTKTRYCLSWAEAGATRLQVNCTIEWSGKSWLKGPIEKGANDGQIQYSRDLVVGLRAAINAKPKAVPAVIVVKGGKKKGKKGEKSAKILVGAGGVEEIRVETQSATKKSDLGPLEPLYDILKAVFDIVGPMIRGNLPYVLVVVMLIAYWSRSSSSSGNNSQGGVGLFAATPARIAAYEEIWRREESDLWNWLEERVGMERGSSSSSSSGSGGASAGSSLDLGRGLGERLNALGLENEGTTSEREIETAIRVTEEKLRALRGVVERRKEKEKERDRTTRVEDGKGEL